MAAYRNNVGNFQRCAITPSSLECGQTTPGTFPRTATERAARTDCANTGYCTWDEEMTNYANWYAYYRSRMQMMKTVSGQTFVTLADSYRVGLVTINYAKITTLGNSAATEFLPISDFGAVQKSDWFNTLYQQVPGSNTPLKFALDAVGKYYKTKPGPIDNTYGVCQANYTLLTTDGYANETDWTGTVQADNVESRTAPKLCTRDNGCYDGGVSGNSGTLSDIAAFYASGDLRTDLDNKVPVRKPEKDNNENQHMVTFTLGLGIDGLMRFREDYEDATEGDLYKIKTGATGCPWISGTCNWPKLVNNSPPAVDDLWHAAISGRGKYFSAGNPTTLKSGLTETLRAIQVATGAAAAAATSTPNVTQDDNYIFRSTYRTVLWDGQIYADTIDLTNGEVNDSSTAVWDVTKTYSKDAVVRYTASEYVFKAKRNVATATPPPATAVDPSDDWLYLGRWGRLWNAWETLDPRIVTTTIDQAAPLPPKLVTAESDTRLIYTGKFSGTGSPGLVPFDWTNLGPSGLGLQAYVSNKCTGTDILPQCGGLSPAEKAVAQDGEQMVNYLRGHRKNEYAVIYREREHVLGDIGSAAPAYQRRPRFDYTDAGYATFKTNKDGRAAAVFAAANDGMLHAFDALSGSELWAYVPRQVIPQMWRLASTEYANQHRYYVDGTPVIGDAYADFDGSGPNAEEWRSILVGGLNNGGRGFYALDVTDPASPKPLWEFCSDSTLCPKSDANMGRSYGNPVITKVIIDQSGTPKEQWVVLVTSGYNNVPDGTFATGDGKGYLYVLDIVTGAVLKTLTTGEGSWHATDGTKQIPSGLARIAGAVERPQQNNLTTQVYGGDLLGNMWRFNLTDPAGDGVLSTWKVEKLGVATDSASAVQPITTVPRIAKCEADRVVAFGTGRFIGSSDLSNKQLNSLYGLREEVSAANALTSIGAVRTNSAVVQQTLATSGAKFTVSRNPVPLATKYGWYLDLNQVPAASGSERVNLDPNLIFGTLNVITNVPDLSSNACATGGAAYQYDLDVCTGQTIGAYTNPSTAAKVASILSSGPTSFGCRMGASS